MTATPRKPRRQTATRTADQVRVDLINAADREHPVTIEYVNGKGVSTRRVVEPVGLVTSGSGEIMLVAWCRLRGDKRTFRVDRITAYSVHSRVGFFVVDQGDWDAANPTVIFPAEGEHEATGDLLADLSDQAEVTGDVHVAAALWSRALWHYELANERAARLARVGG